MSSILTNNSAMVALQTLKGINQGLNRTQNDISTGKSIATARDNAAVWAISKTMESDVLGFKGISDSLAVGSSTIAVARSAAERITDLLGEVKQKIVASQEENQDRTKIQQDIVALRGQISSIVGAAQFNGLNLLSNDKGFGATGTQVIAGTGAGAGIMGSSIVTVLSSLDRSSDGSVSASHIDAGRSDLGTQAAKVGGAATGFATGATSTAMTAAAGGVNGTGKIVITGDTTAARLGNKVVAGDGYEITTLTGTGLLPAGTSIVYVARDGDTTEDVARNLSDKVNFHMTKNGVGISSSVAKNAAGDYEINFVNETTATPGLTVTYSSGGTIGGGLELLGLLDVSTANGAKASLGAIEGLIQTAIKAASDFGSTQKRIDIQKSFVNSLTDSLKAGIGALVDADMEEASARLQALQVQQQLGIQALSIANQAPQNILALFR